MSCDKISLHNIKNPGGYGQKAKKFKTGHKMGLNNLSDLKIMKDFCTGDIF